MHVSKLAPHFGTLRSFPHVGFSFRLGTDSGHMMGPIKVNEAGQIVYSVSYNAGDTDLTDSYTVVSDKPVKAEKQQTGLWYKDNPAVLPHQEQAIGEDILTLHHGITALAKVAPQKPLETVLKIIQDFGTRNGSTTDTLQNPELKALVEA